MTSIMEIITKETNGKNYKSFKYCYDGVDVPSFDYDDHKEISWKKYGETHPKKEYKDLKPLADKISQNPPLFTFFLDGSRRAYKVDDIAYNNRVYPVIAGQVGISCCKRKNRQMKKYDFKKRLVIVLPSVAKQIDWDHKNVFFNNLCKKINENDIGLQRNQIKFTDILPYSTKKDNVERIENKGIAVIQGLMIESEIEMVTKMVENQQINADNYLLKDGSLEYRVDHLKNKREKRRFASNFSCVVGVSKSFNPENCKDKNGKNNSNMVAKLPLYHRTPVSMYTSERLEGMAYAVWYVRIRSNKYTTNTFDGILKIEKILSTDEQIISGLETDEVDMITANIINERNPVCYGSDTRWANHLYPIYVTECYTKSQFLSNTMFLNLF